MAKKKEHPAGHDPRDWSPRRMKYTVIGYWADENQPWIEWGRGFSPHDGMVDALKHAMEENQWDEDYMMDLFVIEVIEGHHSGVLGNRHTVGGKDALSGDYEAD